MKALMSLTAFFLSGLIALLAWQYSIDPRYSDATTLRTVVSDISRAIFGEHCRAQYKVVTRPDTMEYAREILTIESMTWRGGDYDGHDLAFNSQAFRSEWPSNKIRDGNGWVADRVVYDGVDQWGVAYLFSDAVRSIHMSVRFTPCRRILDTKHAWHGANPLR